MKKIMFPWNLKKHFILSLFLSVIVEVVGKFSGFYSEASSIGIIGGADGPTSIFITPKTGNLLEFGSIGMFIILMVLYKPMKLLISKHFAK